MACWALQISSAAAAAKSLQSCPTLWDPTDGSPPGSPVPGILQARTLEWVAIAFSNAWKWKVKVKSLSCFRLLATPRTAAYQAPPPMGFSRQEYWSGVPLPSPIPHYKWLQICHFVCGRLWIKNWISGNHHKGWQKVFTILQMKKLILCLVYGQIRILSWVILMSNPRLLNTKFC